MRSTTLRSVILVAIAVVVSPALGELPMTGAYVPELQNVDSLLQAFMVGKTIPGGTMAITHNGQVVYERGIGYRDWVTLRRCRKPP